MILLKITFLKQKPLILIFKRYIEKPQRKIKVWLFDVFKQCAGGCYTHVMNIGVSYLFAIEIHLHINMMSTF